MRRQCTLLGRRLQEGEAIAVDHNLSSTVGDVWGMDAEDDNQELDAQ